MMTMHTVDSQGHALVHEGSYKTIEPPAPKKRGIHYIHLRCGLKIRQGDCRSVYDDNPRYFVTCVRCARWPKYKD